MSTSILATIGDPGGTRTITSLVALLVAMGLALVMVAVWLYRTTRPDAELLAPLEAMGERSWQRLDPVGQRRRLDELRPDEAEPISPSVAPPALDAMFDAGPAAPGFDDLQGIEPVTSSPSAPRRHTTATGQTLPSPVAETPQQIDRPDLDDFGQTDIDPDVLAAAAADLEAELRMRSVMSESDTVVDADDEGADDAGADDAGADDEGTDDEGTADHEDLAPEIGPEHDVGVTSRSDTT